MVTVARIFLSYRRDDSAYVAGVIRDKFIAFFGSGSVFFDVYSIPLGTDFRQYLHDEVAQCDVLVALIGDRWLYGRSDGRRRLDDPNDFVRIEIESALQRDIPVIPVFLDHMEMLREEELPSSIKTLSYRNAAEIRAGRDFNQHINRLIQDIHALITANANRRKRSLSSNKNSRAQHAPLQTCTKEGGLTYGANPILPAVAPAADESGTLWKAWRDHPIIIGIFLVSAIISTIVVVILGPSPSPLWIEVTKSTLIVQQPSLSDEFKMKNVRDKPVQWFLKNFPKQIVSLHGHAMEGRLEPNVWSDRLQVRGHSEHIISQTTKEHVFFIVGNYGNFSTQEKIKVITDDPNDLREWYYNQIKLPSPQ